MKNIVFEKRGLKVVTYLKSRAPRLTGDEVDGFAVTEDKHHPLILRTADEIPLFFFAPGRIAGAIRLGKEETLAETLKTKLGAVIEKYSIRPTTLIVYFGPCITFSHVPVERPFIEDLMKRGYRSACKRTDGVDYFDMPVMKNSHQYDGLVESVVASYKDQGINLHHWTASLYSELFREGADKGHALEYILKELGLQKKDVIAFGDADNDDGMLERAEVAYAMKNCKSKILQKKYRCTKKGNSLNGVAQTLRDELKL